MYGLSFEAGDGLNDAEMAFGGSTRAILALDGLVFTPDAGFAGRAALPSLAMIRVRLGLSLLIDPSTSLMPAIRL